MDTEEELSERQMMKEQQEEELDHMLEIIDDGKEEEKGE